RDRQERDRDDAGDHDEDRHHPGKNRPVYEESGHGNRQSAEGSVSEADPDATARAPFPAHSSAVTGAPGRTFWNPSTTTRSPASRPDSTTQRSPAIRPTRTVRSSATLSSLTT